MRARARARVSLGVRGSEAVAQHLDEAVDVHARQMDLVGVEIARLHDLLHLGDAHLARGGGVGIEVAARAWLGLELG